MNNNNQDTYADKLYKPLCYGSYDRYCQYCEQKCWFGMECSVDSVHYV